MLCTVRYPKYTWYKQKLHYGILNMSYVWLYLWPRGKRLPNIRSVQGSSPANIQEYVEKLSTFIISGPPIAWFWNKFLKNKPICIFHLGCGFIFAFKCLTLNTGCHINRPVRAFGNFLNLLATDFFQILAHPVFKMWVIQKPNKVSLWNKRHFEEKRMEIIQHV